MTDPKVIEALDALLETTEALLLQEGVALAIATARERIAALRAEATPVEKPDTCCKASGCTMDANGVCDLTALPPLPALPEGVRPLVFDSTGVAAEPHDVTALSDEAIVHAAASSFEDAQAIARVMYAAAEWHRAGFDLVPVRRTP